RPVRQGDARVFPAGGNGGGRESATGRELLRLADGDRRSGRRDGHGGGRADRPPQTEPQGTEARGEQLRGLPRLSHGGSPALPLGITHSHVFHHEPPSMKPPSPSARTRSRADTATSAPALPAIAKTGGGSRRRRKIPRP